MSIDLIGVFGAGLLTFLTPCVLPLIPIYLSALVGADIRTVSGQRQGQLMLRTGFFSAGFILVFVSLGLTASSIGVFLSEHKTALQLFGAFVLSVFGLKFLGVLQIPFLDRVVKADDRKLQTRFFGLNAFVMGVVFAAGWSPCAGPVLGSVLTYTASVTSNPWTGALYLGFYGLGFAVPLVVVALFAEFGLGLLKKLNPHLKKIERALGLFLLFVAGTLVFDQVSNFRKSPVQDHPTEMKRLDSYPSLLIFTSRDCHVCQRMQPLLKRLQEECHGNKILLKTHSLDDPGRGDLIRKHRLVATPTFLFVDKSGQEVARLVGEQTELTLKQAMSALRNEPCPGINLLSQSQTSEGLPKTLAFPESAKENPGCKTEAQPESTTEKQTGLSGPESCQTLPLPLKQEKKP